MPLWARLIPFAIREILIPIWQAIQSGEHQKAAHLAKLAALRQAEKLAAEKLLTDLSNAKKD